MEVTIHGVRGSIPSPGPATVRYGGNTVSVSLRLADGTRVVIDAGTGIRGYGKEIVAEGLDRPVHFLLSHRHYDHIIGLPFFDPIYQADFELLVYPLRGEVKERRRLRAEIFDGIQTPMRLDDLPARIIFQHEAPEPWSIGTAQVRRIDLNHPGGAQGFRVDDADGSSLCYLTDNELSPPGAPRSTPQEQADFARHSGLLICDSQYLPEDLPAKRGWGHSTVPEVLALGRAAQPWTQLLFHHDPDRSDPELDAIADMAERFAAAESLRGPALVAREGMRFEVRPDGCRAISG